jgi:hypothetical protein
MAGCNEKLPNAVRPLSYTILLEDLLGIKKWSRKHGGSYAIAMTTPVNSMSFIWNDNMREKREANANATWRALIRDRPRGDGV